MKIRKLYLVGILLVILAVALPVAAFAAKAQEFDVTVRNRTGYPAEVKVIGADGLPHMFTAPAGFSKITLPEGVQNYWVSSACGNDAGTWNLNVNKTLWIDCSPMGGAAWLRKLTSARKAILGCADTGMFVYVAPGLTIYFSETNWDVNATGSVVSYLDYFNDKIQFYEIYKFACMTDDVYTIYATSPNWK